MFLILISHRMATSLLSDARFDDDETRNLREFNGDVSVMLEHAKTDLG